MYESGLHETQQNLLAFAACPQGFISCSGNFASHDAFDKSKTEIFGLDPIQEVLWDVLGQKPTEDLGHCLGL